MDQENPHDNEPDALDQPTPESDPTEAGGPESLSDAAPESNDYLREPDDDLESGGIEAQPGPAPELQPNLAETLPVREETIELPQNLRVLIRIGLVLLALLALSAHISLAWLHSGDRFGIDHTAATWIALSQHAGEGMLYPPLYDEESGQFGGTRHMPIGILLNAFGAKLTGEYFRSAKIISEANMALMVLVMLMALLRMRCSVYCALGLIGAMLMTVPALQATTSVRCDALPLALQLMAILLFVPKRHQNVDSRSVISGPRVCLAAFLCTLAFFSKLSAVWALISIGIWLLSYHPRRFLTFMGYSLGMILVGAAGLNLMTDGRFVENVFALAFVGVESPEAFFLSPARVLYQLLEYAPASWTFLPLAALSLMLAITRQRLSIVHLSLLASLLVLLVVLADRGAGENHLLDFIVLIALCAGDLWRWAANGRRTLGFAQAAMAILLIWSITSGLIIHVRRDLAEAAMTAFEARGVTRYDLDPFHGTVNDEMNVLSEDASVEIARGKLPVVLDPWMLPIMARNHPDWIEALAGRIERGEFDRIILLRRLYSESTWYRDHHFGLRIAEAIEANYTFLEQHGEYFLYAPNGMDSE